MLSPRLSRDSRHSSHRASQPAPPPSPMGLTHRPPALHDSSTASTVQPVERTWTSLFTRISPLVGRPRPSTAPDRSPNQERGRGHQPERVKKMERENDAWLSDEQLAQCAPADVADVNRMPIPTQIVSNGEYMPARQTDKQ